MDTQRLEAAGLSEQHAKVYALLLDNGDVTPPDAAKILGLTRSNAYKALDRLVDMQLATREDVNKKLTYRPTNPTVFADISARARAEVVAREEAVSSVMQDLLGKYYAHSDSSNIESFSGVGDIKRAYHKQLSLREDLYFIHTPADVPTMGFDVMHEIRTTPARHGSRRHGILTAPLDTTINYDNHRRSNLEITWAEQKLYDAPVEWSATNTSLLIVAHAAQPRATLIIDPVIAGSFIQLWKLMDKFLCTTSTHQSLAPKT